MKGLFLFGATTGKVHKARKCILFQNSPMEFQFRIGSINGPERSGMFVDPRFYCNKYQGRQTGGGVGGSQPPLNFGWGG